MEFNVYFNKILFRSRLHRVRGKNMKAIGISRANSAIETAIPKAFSNILLSLLFLNCPTLKSKVSKIEMLSNNILLNRIYIDADTNVL